jgi:hypothetical protein
MNAVGVRCRLKQLKVFFIEVGLDVVDWVAVSNELLVVPEGIVATRG